MNIVATLFGVIFGALLVGSRVTNYNVIHQGLLLHSAYVYLMMGSAMLVGLLCLWVLERMGWKTRLGGPLRLRRLSIGRKHILGGVLFGVGWAVTGTCPAVSAAQLGNGILAGGVVMVGLFAGTLLRDLVRG
jgi:uncharacterized protein